MRTPLWLLRTSILCQLGCSGFRPADKDTASRVPSWSSEPFGVPEPVAPSGSAVCAGAAPIRGASGLYTGFYRCPDGTAHRVEAATVDPNWDHQSCQNTEDDRACEVDADCTERAYGRCVTEAWDPDGDTRCGCAYSCARDSDCDGGEVCVDAAVRGLGGAASVCVPASCEDSTQCECGFSTYASGCGDEHQVGCRTSEDTCRLDAECPSKHDNMSCSLLDEEAGAWACNPGDCTPGRPLTVAGQPRTAPTVSRRDWSSSSSVLPVPPAVAAALATHWAAVGALEHASVASFARFSLQLMALGAPPDLLAGAQRAAQDEIVHARLAYGLAGAYRGACAGPGPLPLDGVQLDTRPEAVLADLIAEGCVNETLAAAAAAAAQAGCADPAVAAVLQQIVDDESAHAALAWRTLRWLLEAHPALLDRAAACFTPPPRQLPAGGRPGLPAHGVLGDAALAASREAAWSAVIDPCWRALRRRLLGKAPLRRAVVSDR